MVQDILKMNSSWEFLKKAQIPVILYGTGNGADKIIDEYERLGIKLSGVMASDSFVRDRFFRGFKVKSAADFENEFGDFIITVGFASQLEDVLQNIINLSKRHKVIVPCVSPFSSAYINREFLEKYSDRLEKVYSLLADEKSKRVFEDVLEFNFTGELDALFRNETDKEEAFENILKLGKDEYYLDLGAYRGDTVEEFLRFCSGEYSAIKAIEPDSKSYSKLEEYIRDKENCSAVNCGIWNENTTLIFTGKGGRRNAVAPKGKSVEVRTVDFLCENFPVTYLKADIEGCENEMLVKCEKTFASLKPKLNIAAYHKSEDIFTLPEKILELNSEYKIYLRHHRYIPCWDLNYYCV